MTARRPSPRHRATVVISAATLAAAALLFRPAPSRAVDFQFLYDDPAGQGFFDPVLGDQRRAAFAAGANIIGQLIRPTYTDEAINVVVSSTNDPTANYLGEDFSGYYYSNFGSSDPRYLPNTQYVKPLASHLLGHNVEIDHPDVHIKINFGYSFYLGTDANPPADQFDLPSVVSHEIIHGLGFFSSFRQEGGYGFFGDGTYSSDTGLSGSPLVYDRYITLSPGGSPLLSLSDANRTAALTSNNLYWNGPNGITGNAGAPPQVDAENPWQDGVNVGHLDATAFPNDVISEGIGPGQQKQAISSVDRGILRDIGWDISVASSTVTWTPAGANNLASNYANWSQSPYPGDALRFTNNAAGVFDVRMDLSLYQLDRITLTPSAPSYTFHISPYTSYDLTGPGIENQTALVHTFILESHQDVGPSVDVGSAAVMAFRNVASASNSVFELHGGFSTPQHAPTDHYDRFNGAEMDFYNTASAATATFNLQGAAGDGAPSIYARLNFRDTSNAASATINNQPGRQGVALSGISVAGFGAQTRFLNSASAAFATINNIGQDSPNPGGTGGVTDFYDTSNAGAATFNNQGATAAGYGIGVGGATQFFGHSSAASATLVNQPSIYSGGGGNTYFGDDATAATANIENQGNDPGSNGPGTTTFYTRSTAGNSTIYNRGIGGIYGGLPGTTSFHDDTSAGSALIRNYPAPAYGGRTEFHDRSSAATAHITLEPGNAGGTIAFYDQSTAANAHLDAGASGATGTIVFHDQSSAANATIDLNSSGGSNLFLQFFDNATGGNAVINAGASSRVQFYSTASLGNATINLAAGADLYVPGGYYGGATAGTPTIHLLGGTFTNDFGASASYGLNATAGNANITVEGAAAAGAYPASVAFTGGSDMGTATILLKSSPISGAAGGSLSLSGAISSLARVITQTGSVVSASSYYGDPTLGSIEGAGGINVNGANLTVGALGLSTTLSGPVTGYAGNLAKIGAGTFTLSGASNYAGTLSVLQGTLLLQGSNALASPYASAAGASLQFLTPHSATTLSALGATRIAAPLTLAPNSGPSLITDFSIDPGASLDLANNPLTLASTAPATLRQLILAGQLTSSTPDPSHSLSLGYIPGNPVLPGSLLLKLTYTGDANLDGLLNADDYALLDAGFANHASNWSQGDFNYDGIINNQDYLLIDSAYLSNHTPSPDFLAERESQFGANYVTQLLASVPEPAAPLACLIATSFLPRRRKP